MAVVVDENFFRQLPKLEEVDKESADMAWLIYGFQKSKGRYVLKKKNIKYTHFEDALATITTPNAGDVKDFVVYLKDRIAKGRTMGTPEQSGVAPEVEPLFNSFRR